MSTFFDNFRPPSTFFHIFQHFLTNVDTFRHTSTFFDTLRQISKILDIFSTILKISSFRHFSDIFRHTSTYLNISRHTSTFFRRRKMNVEKCRPLLWGHLNQKCRFREANFSKLRYRKLAMDPMFMLNILKGFSPGGHK